jgi:hypothetical protein
MAEVAGYSTHRPSSSLINQPRPGLKSSVSFCPRGVTNDRFLLLRDPRAAVLKYTRSDYTHPFAHQGVFTTGRGKTYPASTPPGLSALARGAGLKTIPLPKNN